MRQFIKEKNLRQVEPNEPLSIDEIARLGAIEMLRIKLIEERQRFLDAHAAILLADGKPAIVANGYAPEREVYVGSGALPFEMPRTRNRLDKQNEQSSINFVSKIIPPYMKRSPKLDECIPLLYLYGVSTSDMLPALQTLLGKSADGISAANVAKMMKEWCTEIEAWRSRDLTAKEYCYIWVDGIHFNVRLDEERLCILVLIGATKEGRKELIGVATGYRESEASWSTFLRFLKEKGLKSPKLFIGDGALGFWKASKDVYPEARSQRCWVHKTANVLDKMPKSVQPQAKTMIHEVFLASTKVKANEAFDKFIAVFEDKYPKAVECFSKDRDQLLAFYDFPAKHWRHIRSTNPIESAFSTVRLRHRKTRGNGSKEMTEAMVFKLLQKAEMRFQRLNGYACIEKVMLGVQFVDGIEIAA